MFGKSLSSKVAAGSESTVPLNLYILLKAIVEVHFLVLRFLLLSLDSLASELFKSICRNIANAI